MVVFQELYSTHLPYIHRLQLLILLNTWQEDTVIEEDEAKLSLAVPPKPLTTLIELRSIECRRQRISRWRDSQKNNVFQRALKKENGEKIWVDFYPKVSQMSLFEKNVRDRQKLNFQSRFENKEENDGWEIFLERGEWIEKQEYPQILDCL